MSCAAPIVIVGGAGFIGRALGERLAGRGLPVLAVTRRAVALAPDIAVHAIGDITPATDWAPVVAGARAVVHLASRAHAPLDEGGNHAWIENDAQAAARLAAAAQRAGIARLVLLSSIKVMGEATRDQPFRADQPIAPADPYGIAKARIEEAMRLAAPSGPALAILRPPLVYGPGVKANFRALLRLADRGLPLPLASIGNRRALIFLDNLLDLIEILLTGATPASGVFLLRDEEEVSTPELVRRMARSLGRSARLFPCPPGLLRAAARLAGRSAAADRLLGSLQIDDAATRAALGWHPRLGLDEGLAKTGQWYRTRPIHAGPP